MEALDHPKEITLFMTDMSHYQGMLDIWARGMEIPIIDIEDIKEMETEDIIRDLAEFTESGEDSYTKKLVRELINRL